MAFQMQYDARNRMNLDRLAPNTRAAAYDWYERCIVLEADVLIYETIRTEEQQRKYVASGASQTMQSYHLTGQALDFVPIIDGQDVWGGDAYRSEPYASAIAYAKQIGFEWGGDWQGFVDTPHLQYEYKGYGTDITLDENVPSSSPDAVEVVTDGEYIGKKLTVKVDGLWYYNTPRWDIKDGVSNAGDGFIITEELRVGGARMVRCHDGKYRTASFQYVDVDPKPSDWPYRVVMDDITYAQAKQLVIELQTRGLIQTFGEAKGSVSGEPEDDTPYRVIIEGITHADAKLLVIEWQTKGYSATYGEAK